MEENKMNEEVSDTAKCIDSVLKNQAKTALTQLASRVEGDVGLMDLVSTILRFIDSSPDCPVVAENPLKEDKPEEEQREPILG